MYTFYLYKLDLGKPGTLVRKIEKLPENLKRKAEVFGYGLISNAESSEKIPSTGNNRGYGSLKVQIWMPEDFNEPLEDFKDYI